MTTRSTHKPLPDVLGRDLSVLFCGINPSLYSAEHGHHYARPGNRFWPALHGAGFTPRLWSPDEDRELPTLGVGLTNVCDRPTRAADELSKDELRAGAAQLAELAAGVQPKVIAIVGIGAYRTGFARPDAQLGLQPDAIGGRPAWVLPNTSGLNAHYQLPALVERFAALLAHSRQL
jgi:TDG/mug DNA glycosylase family protein